MAEGHRVSLVFNLFLRSSEDGLKAPDYTDRTTRVAECLAEWRDEGVTDKLVWLLEHEYSEDGPCFDTLKNTDATVAQVLGEAADRADCELHAVMLRIEEYGSPEFEPVFDRWGWEWKDDGNATMDEVVRHLTGSDPGRDRRQLAVIDAEGRVRAYTGSATSDWAGHIEGENYSVQGNIFAGEAVVKAMADAFESSRGPLALRLMDGLDAGQAAGGDARGKQAGGVLVVKPIGDSGRTTDRWVDVRVDDHAVLRGRRPVNDAL